MPRSTPHPNELLRRPRRSQNRCLASRRRCLGCSSPASRQHRPDKRQLTSKASRFRINCGAPHIRFMKASSSLWSSPHSGHQGVANDPEPCASTTSPQCHHVRCACGRAPRSHVDPTICTREGSSRIWKTERARVNKNTIFQTRARTVRCRDAPGTGKFNRVF